MEQKIKVSIIIPVHNSENTLDRCIKSILLQSYKNIECILIENGSIDNSKALCKEYEDKYENIIFVSTNIKGVSNARNIGLSMATGYIIGFCDADDFLEKNAISMVVKEFMDKSDIVAVFGGFNIGYDDKKKHINKIYKGMPNKMVSIKKAKQLILINDSIMGSVCNKFYKHEILKNKKFNEYLSFCEDMHFNAIVLDSIPSQYSVKIIKNPLYCYMYNPNSVTNSAEIFYDENNELKYIVALKKIEKDCKLDLRTKSILRMKIACFAIDYLNGMVENQNQIDKLIIELKKNYIHLISNIFLNHCKLNVKRVFCGFKYLIM